MSLERVRGGPPGVPSRHAPLRRWRVALLLALLSANIAAASVALYLYVEPPLVEIFSGPRRFSRRQGDFTVNVCGITSRAMGLAGRGLRYRVNDGPWREIRQDYKRTHSRHFRIEMSHEELLSGRNELVIEAAALGLGPERWTVPFAYDPSPPRLPAKVFWRDATLEVEDGAWERLLRGGTWWVRPVIGHEGYDRLLVAAGAFPGGRRVSADLVFRYSIEGRPYGFGIVPMWGGRPDRPGTDPRDGWSLSLVWFWNRYEGYGSEFTYKFGHQPPAWTNSYRNLELSPGVRYHVLAEVREEVDPKGRHLRYHQRAKWWSASEPEPSTWTEVSDQGAALPPAEYGVALIAYWSQVEFGPVLIEPLDPVVRER